MCGIYGVVGDVDAFDKAVEGIKRLDYRGYDSWGVGLVGRRGLNVVKEVGVVPEKVGLSPTRLAVAHTRWATHGGVTQANAHPHMASDGSFLLVHNGIVENEAELRAELVDEEYEFVSQTDSEVIVGLLETSLKEGSDRNEVILGVVDRLVGRNAVVIVFEDGKVYVYRNGSPLLLGRGGEMGVVLASDVASMAGQVQGVLMLGDGDVLCIDDKAQLWNVRTGKELPEDDFEEIHVDSWQADKGSYEDFMIKEIHDIPDMLQGGYDAWYEQTALVAKKLTDYKRVYVVGSGTAGVAAEAVAYLLRDVAGVDALGLKPEEMSSYESLVDKDCMVIALSQSGETADVLQVLEKLVKKQVMLVSFVNMPESMMLKMADVAIEAKAGVEKAVMSTKVFVAQVAWGWMLAQLTVGVNVNEVVVGMESLAEAVDELLKDEEENQKLSSWAQRLADEQDILMMGDGLGLLMLEEGRIKLTEAAYLPTQAISAASLKHFAITLMEEGRLVIVNGLGGDERRMASAVAEIGSRGAVVYGFNNQEQESWKDTFVVSGEGVIAGIASVVGLQMLAYFVTKQLGNSPDKPRNIAKSVTVL